MQTKTSQLIFLWCLFLSVQVHSQKMDSLKNELLHQNGEERFTILYDLVFEYLDNEDYREALTYIEEAQQVAAQYDDSLHIVKAGRVKGLILIELERTADAINELQKVVSVSKRNKFEDDHEAILNGLAIAHTLQANYDKALQYHFECLTMREKRGNFTNICSTLNNIGLVYYKLQNSEKALEYYKRTLKESDKIGFKDAFDFKDRLLINIGLCYNELRDYAAAKKFIMEGMKLCAPECNDETIIQGEFGLGVSFFSLDKPMEAEKHFLVSYRVSKKQDDKRLQLENLVYLARIKNAAGLYGAVNKLLQRAESVCSETQYNELLIKIYKQFSELYIETKDYKNATRYQSKYITLNDSIHSGELTKNLMKIQAEYEEHDNKAKIASQEQILKLREEVISKQRFLNFLVGMVAVLFVMLTLIFFTLSRQRKIMNVLLDRKVGERTMALEKSLNDLRRSHDEQEILFRTISSDMKASVATIRGLCALSSGLEDQPGANISFVKEFEETAGRIAEIMNRVQRIAEN